MRCERYGLNYHQRGKYERINKKYQHSGLRK